jgi:glycerol-3-phosphate acyltransferase PlsY
MLLASDWSLYDVLALVLGYLLGSIPFGLILTRVAGHGDLRQIGSGNIGATNVLRTGDKRLAALTLVLDALKGTAAVLIGARLGPDAAILGGLGAFLGHLFPAWLGFRGGKGVATAAGVFSVLAPLALGCAAAVFLLVVWLTRYISAGSIAATLTLAVATLATSAPAVVAAGAAAAAAIIINRHRANLSRLLAGTERRVGQ